MLRPSWINTSRSSKIWSPARRRLHETTRGTAAEVLEDRTLLSATFGLTNNALAIDEFTQIADENLTIRESGTTYEFVLFEGVWTGTEGGGVNGAGTGVLSVEKAAVAGLAGGIAVSASAVATDIALWTTDFSTLSGGLSVTGAGAVTQAAGRTLSIEDLAISAKTVALSGTVSGGAGAVTLLATQQIVLGTGAAVTSTTGAIILVANDAGDAVSAAGIVLDAALIATETGAITLRGHGGSLEGGSYGLSVLSGSQILSTGSAAGALQLSGTGGGLANSHAVYLAGASIRSAYGNIEVAGTAANGDGVAIRNQAVIESFGTGPGAGTVAVTGTSTSSEGGSGVILADAQVVSVDGAVTVAGSARALAGSGVAVIAGASIRSDGLGSISVTGAGISTGSGITLGNTSSIRTAGAQIDIAATAGSLTASDSLIVSTGGTITLSAARHAACGVVDAGPTGRVFVTGAWITINATAAGLSMQANGSISAVTRVTAVEASAGSVTIRNTGDMTIGGVDAGLSGIAAAEIILENNQGSIYVNRAGETLAAHRLIGLNLLGESDLITGGGNSARLGGRDAIRAGRISIKAGRDVLIGDAAAGAAGDIIGGSILVQAVRDVLVDAGSALDVVGEPVFGSSQLSVSAGRDVRYLATGGVTGASSATPGIGLGITAGGTFVADSGAATVLATTRDGKTAAITVFANDMAINGGIDAGRDPLRSLVTLHPSFPDAVRRDVVLGTDVDPRDPSVGALGLTDAELDWVTAHWLRVQSGAYSSAIHITGTITQTGSGYAALSLYAYGGIFDATPGEQVDLAVESLTLQTVRSAIIPIGAAGDGDIDIAAASFAAHATGDVHIKTWGTSTVDVGDEWLGRVPSPGPLQGVTSDSGDIVIASHGAGADLIVNRPAVAAGSIALQAADSVRFTSTAALTAGHGISVIANTDDVASNDGDVLAMADGAVLDGGTGQILLSTAGAAVDVGGSGGRITLGRLVTTYGIASETDAAVTILTDADVVDGGDTGGAEIQAIEGLLVIDAVGGIGFWTDFGADAALETDVGSLLITNRLAGDVAIDEYDGITVPGIDQRAETGRVVLQANTDLSLPSQRVYSVRQRPSGVWIQEHRSDGMFVREWALPPRPRPQPGDLVVDAAGRIHLIDTEREAPTIFTLDPRTGSFRETSLPAGTGWYATRGSIAASGQFLFVVDPTAPAGTARLIRMNADTGETTTFTETFAQQTYGYRQVAAGLDGLIYADSIQSVVGSYHYRVTVIDPATLSIVKSVRLDIPVYDIAVDAHGVIFGVDDAKAYRFGRAGEVVAEMPLPSSGSGVWIDLDINPDGTTLVTSVDRVSPVSRMAFFDADLQFVQRIDVADSERFSTTFRPGAFGSLIVEPAAAGGLGVVARSGEVILEARGTAGDIVLGASIRTSGMSLAEGAVTLAAGRSIQAGDAESDVTATSLTLVAETGIGTRDNPLQVALTAPGDAGRIDIDAGAGGVHLVSDGSLKLGDLTASAVNLAVNGGVTITSGATLDVSQFDYRGLTPSDPRILVANDGAEAISGTFSGLAEGTILKLVAGQWVRITYVGGDGNDLALVAEEIVDSWQAESPAMGHLIGRRDGDGWSANTKLDPQGFLLFGPYTTAIPAGIQIATFRMLVDNTTFDNAKVARLEVFDAATGSLLAQRALHRGEFAAPFQYQDFELAFRNPAGSRLEFRLWWYDTSYVRVDAVRVTTAPPPPLVLEAETQLHHQLGRATAEGWTGNPALDGAGFLAFGPYTTAVPAGRQSATFRLRVDNNSANNAPIVTLDVHDAATGRMLAQRVVRRADFVAANAFQEFVLDFENPFGSRLEFRVYWHDTAVMTLDRVLVTQTPTPPPLRFEAETPGLFQHQVGEVLADSWAAEPLEENPGFLAWGLDTASVPTGSHAALFRLLVGRHMGPNDPIVTVDVVDNNRGQVLASRTITRNEFKSSYIFQTFALAFTNSAGTSLDFRTYWHDTAYVQLDRVAVLDVPSPQWLIETEGPLVGHTTGQATFGGWSANVNQDAAGWLATGPYDQSVLPSGRYTASFRLLVDNHQANNDLIVTLDVFDRTSGQVLARRTLTRFEFEAANAFQEFGLTFTSAPEARLEYRTFWHGRSYVEQDAVSVRPATWTADELEPVFDEIEDLLLTA